MHQPNVDKILKDLKLSDAVLEIGGSSQPFSRANYMIDISPYESRGRRGYYGSREECFTKDTWITRDVCSHAPFPFKDKQFDFAIASHILEDIRDPISVCAELIRVAKRGYIEVPSRVVESISDLHYKGCAGLAHHRWFVEIEDQNIQFRLKSNYVDSSKKFTLPKSHLKNLTEGDWISYLFWEDSFEFSEVNLFSVEDIEKEQEAFIQMHRIPAIQSFCSSVRRKILGASGSGAG